MTTHQQNQPTIEEQPEPRPFTWLGHPRYEFRDWVKQQFPQLLGYAFKNPDIPEYPELARRLGEVHQAVTGVLDQVMRFSDRSLQDYYRKDIVNLNQAFKDKNVRDYAIHLSDLLFGIDWE